MAQVIYLSALAVAYAAYMNEIEEKIKGQDELLVRLGHNETNYALHNREILDISSLSKEICLSLY